MAKSTDNMTIFRTQQFKDVFGQVYEVTNASAQIVMMRRLGDLPEHVGRYFNTTPEHVYRMVGFGRWSAISD